VLIVPVGMALVGQSLGDGRTAYASTSGQLAALAAIAMVAACWFWAGMLLRLPRGDRVFDAT
jgi:tight adherence protein B